MFLEPSESAPKLAILVRFLIFIFFFSDKIQDPYKEWKLKTDCETGNEKTFSKGQFFLFWDYARTPYQNDFIY